MGAHVDISNNEGKTPIDIAEENNRKDIAKIMHPLVSYKEVDVPGDGNCLFWSVALAYLTPVKFDDYAFYKRFKKLFEEGYDVQAMQKLIQDNINVYGNNTLRKLVTKVFRIEVIHAMYSNREVLETKINMTDFFESWNESYFITGIFKEKFKSKFNDKKIKQYNIDVNKLQPDFFNEDEVKRIRTELDKMQECSQLQQFMFEAYLECMEVPGAWGGEYEIYTISKLLETMIIVSQKGSEDRIYNEQRKYYNKIHLSYKEEQHYQFYQIEHSNLISFVISFVQLFEIKLAAYDAFGNMLRQEKRMFPQEINIDGFVRCIFGISAYTGERMVSNMRLSLKVGNVTKKTKSFVSLSDMIETFKRYRLDFRKILVDAGCNIFQSFEMQFEKIGFDHVSKIADDTIDKIIEYYTQKEHKKKLDCIGIAEALISDKYSQEVPDKIVKYGKKNYSLRDLYENIEIIREEKSSFVYYRRNNEDKSGQYGYRRFLIGERKDTTYIGIEAKNKGSENYLYTLDSQDFKKIVKEVFNIINQEIQVPSTKIIQNCIVKIKSHIELEVSFLSNYILPYRQDRKKSFNVHMKSFKETAKLRESEKATNSKNRLDRAKKNSKIISLMEENLKKTSNSLYCQKVKKTFVSHTEAICQDYVNSSDLQCTSTARPRNLWSRIKVPSEKGLVSLFRKINLKDVCAPVGEFTGRDEQIDEIYEKLQEGAVAIVGPSGIGKTQLARKFVEENKGVYLHAYEVNTQDILSIESSFASLVRDRLSMCMERERNKERKKCLFLFQGVKKEDLKRILKIRGQRGGFDCLFTSSDLDYQDISEVSLDSLREKHAVQLVKRILEIVDGSQDEQIKALVGKLKGFPLAIKLAAACIKNKGSSPLGEAFGICEYLIQYEKFDQKLPRNTGQNEYARILQITSLISIEAIEEMYSGEEVFKILNAMAYFGCSEINPSVFLAWIRDEDELYSVFELLEQYSMIYSEEEDKYKVYIMHELIKKAIRSQLNIDEEKQILSCVIGLVSETEGGFLEVSHLLSLFEHSQKYDYLIGENKNFPCLVLSSLNKLCEYQKVINLASKSYELLTVDDGYSRLIKYEFACAQASLGWYNRALTIFLDLKKLEKTNGAFSPIALDKKILSTYLKQKNYKEALSYVKRNDFIVTRLFDEEALESIEEYLNVATIVAKIFVMQKKYTEAFTILYYVRQLRDEIFLERNDFKSHGDPYIYPSEAYEFYNLDEKYAYALACFFISQDRKKVTINERMLPCEEDLSPKLSIQALLEQLQDVLKNQEDSQYLQPAPYSIEENIDEGLRKTLSNRTLQYFKKVLKLQKDYEFSESAAIVLSVKFYIALLHSDLGERKRALQELQQLQEIQEEIIGISHPDTLETVDAIQKLFTRGEDRLIYLKNEIEKRESLLQFKRSDLNAQGVSILKEMYAKESSNYYPSVNTSSSEDLLSQDKRPLDIGNTQAKRRKIDNKQVSSYFNDVNVDLSYQQDAIVNLSCI